MKKITLFLTMVSFAVALQAQNYDDVKASLLLHQYKKAKDDLDKKWSNAKFVSKPEAYILKATIYGYLANDSATKLTPEAAALETEAETAFAKFKEMDPTMALLKDETYKNGPILIYSNLFADGFKDYEAKNWAAAYAKFKKVSAMSEILSSQKLLNSAIDTNVLILSAVTAENSGNKDDAAVYYTKMADSKLTGDSYESVYRYLVTYHFNKKDMANFEKYKALGKELYPKSEFFTYDQSDFAVGLDDNFEAKLKSLDVLLQKDPADYKANLSLGQIIYDTLHSRKENPVKPANAAELEPRMIAAFKAAATAKPDNEVAYLFLGDHFINKSIDIGDEKDALMKTVKAGAAPSKDVIAKRDALNKSFSEAYDGAREGYEKAAELIGKKTTMTGQEKQQYKKIAGYLGDIYTYKREQAKGKPADIAEFTKQERKWNDIYAGVK